MKENKKEMIKPLATGLLASGQFMNASYDDRGFPRPAAALRCAAERGWRGSIPRLGSLLALLFTMINETLMGYHFIE